MSLTSKAPLFLFFRLMHKYGPNARGTYPFVTGAMMKVPRPDPQTAIPVAKARFFSKYMDTLTMAGR